MRMRHMTTNISCRVFCALALLFVVARPMAAQVRQTGLTEAPREYLDKVPVAFSPFGGDSLPHRADLSPSLPPPGNQGQQGSCVAWTVAYALRSYQAHVRERAPLIVAPGTIDSTRVFSPAFVYNQINNGRNAGTYFGDALNLVQEIGAVPLSEMPYDAADFVSQPDSATIAYAARYRLLSWKRVDFRDMIEIKSQVNAGYPVMIGARVDSAFMQSGKDFVWHAAGGPPRGGHAMLVVGYDDDRHAVRVMNSWGQDWGDGGSFWLDYDFFPGVVNEAYVAKDRAVPAAPSRRELPVFGPVPAVVTIVPSRPLIPERIVPKVRTVVPPIVRVVIPSLRPPAPSVFDDSRVTIIRTRQDASDSLLGRGIRFDGLVSVPAGAQGSLQVVIHLFVDSAGHKGRFIRATSSRFSVGRERAATGTSPFPLLSSGAINRAWVAFLPYSALDLSNEAPGAVRIVAEPVLYVDRFGVKAGTAATIACRCGR